MNKNIVQDVIPPKKSIRNVKINSREEVQETIPKKSFPRITRDISKPKVEEIKPTYVKPTETLLGGRPPVVPPNNISYKYEFDKPKKKSKKILYSSVFVLVLLGAFGVSAFFKSAKITVTPKNQVLALSDNFSAKKDVTGSALGFQVVTVSKEVEKTAQASGESMVNKKAKGTIVIYNTYGEEAQKLVATTRFQTPEGLIFRLINPVTVPGTSLKSGKTVAGSVEAEVEADKAGAEYNVSFKDFTIPGFKGDPKYTKIYARSKTEMTGGFSGMQKTVSQDLLNQSEKDLEVSLKSALSKDITTQIPADFVLYPSSLTYKIDPVNQNNDSSGNAVLKKRGSASGVIFDKGLLSRAILAKIIPNSVNETIKITNLDSLSFEYSSSTPSDVNNVTSISFSLKGSPQLVWVVDENKIKSELLGLSKNEAKNVISKYTTIKEAWVETQPFWNSTIPASPDKVTILNTLTK